MCSIVLRTNERLPFEREKGRVRNIDVSDVKLNHKIENKRKKRKYHQKKKYED